MQTDTTTADPNSSPSTPLAGVRYRRLLDAARKFAPIRTAVVHPCDVVSLASALEAMEAGLIVPVLVGPAAKIRKAAMEAGRELKDLESSMCRTVTRGGAIGDLGPRGQGRGPHEGCTSYR